MHLFGAAALDGGVVRVSAPYASGVDRHAKKDPTEDEILDGIAAVLKRCRMALSMRLGQEHLTSDCAIAEKNLADYREVFKGVKREPKPKVKIDKSIWPDRYDDVDRYVPEPEDAGD